MLSVLDTIKRNLGNSASAIKVRMGLGYGLSMKSQREWKKVEDEERRKGQAVKHVQRLIEWSHTEYQSALNKHKHNMKIYAELMLDWSPERVLSKHRDFPKLCRAFQSQEMWKMLSRKERKFIADAVQLKSK